MNQQQEEEIREEKARKAEEKPEKRLRSSKNKLRYHQQEQVLEKICRSNKCC